VADLGGGMTLPTPTAHAFSPDGPWFGRCEDCGLSEAAHRATLAVAMRERATEAHAYRCPYCVDRRFDPCEHGRADALGTDRKRLDEVPA
jgi:hypothetical protein